jgi:hypothetical protein
MNKLQNKTKLHEVKIIVRKYMTTHDSGSKCVSYSQFEEWINVPFETEGLPFHISSQVLWGWNTGKHIPKRDTLQMLKKFSLPDMWQYEFACELLEVIDNEENLD